jgi:hypothetical protein
MQRSSAVVVVVVVGWCGVRTRYTATHKTRVFVFGQKRNTRWSGARPPLPSAIARIPVIISLDNKRRVWTVKYSLSLSNRAVAT